MGKRIDLARLNPASHLTEHGKCSETLSRHSLLARQRVGEHTGRDLIEASIEAPDEHGTMAGAGWQEHVASDVT